MKETIIYKLPFKCVKLTEADFNDFAAIYVIICVDDKNNFKVLDVGQSGEIGTRTNSHDRKECWGKYCDANNIWVCIYKTPSSIYTKEQRTTLEGEIRDFYNPKCGKR